VCSNTALPDHDLCAECLEGEIADKAHAEFWSRPLDEHLAEAETERIDRLEGESLANAIDYVTDTYANR
jgi:hypothetical protein